MVSISPDGIQTYAVFIASSNIYEPFLPLVEYIIKSLDIHPTAVNQVLKNQSIESIESEIPVIPKDDNSRLQSEIPQIPTQNDATTQQETFRSVLDTFVTSEPQGFGYDKKANNIFSPGEDIILYIEPKVLNTTATDGIDRMLYTIDFTGDFRNSDTAGT